MEWRKKILWGMLALKMFVYRRRILLRETDATGVLYFSEQMSLAVEAFEAYFFSKGITIQQMIEGDFLLPIVHANANFSAPLYVGDEIEMTLTLGEVGTSSFSIEGRILKKDQEVGTTKVVQVAVSRKTGESIPIPSPILDQLNQL